MFAVLVRLAVRRCTAAAAAVAFLRAGPAVKIKINHGVVSRELLRIRT